MAGLRCALCCASVCRSWKEIIDNPFMWNRVCGRNGCSSVAIWGDLCLRSLLTAWPVRGEELVRLECSTVLLCMYIAPTHLTHYIRTYVRTYTSTVNVHTYAAGLWCVHIMCWLFSCLYVCSLTDESLLKLISRCRPFLGHLNLRGCAFLTPQSFSVIGNHHQYSVICTYVRMNVLQCIHTYVRMCLLYHFICIQLLKLKL